MPSRRRQADNDNISRVHSRYLGPPRFFRRASRPAKTWLRLALAWSFSIAGFAASLAVVVVLSYRDIAAIGAQLARLIFFL